MRSSCRRTPASAAIPCCGRAAYFAEMLQLDGDTGAKRLFAVHADRMREVDLGTDAIFRTSIRRRRWRSCAAAAGSALIPELAPANIRDPGMANV